MTTDRSNFRESVRLEQDIVRADAPMVCYNLVLCRYSLLKHFEILSQNEIKFSYILLYKIIKMVNIKYKIKNMSKME